MQKTMKRAPQADLGRRGGAAALIFLAVPLAAQAAPLDLEGWVAGGLASLPASPTYQALDADRGSAEAFVEAATEQSPWTLGTTVLHGQSFPRELEGLGLDVTTTAEYRRRSGWVGTLAGTLSLVEVPVRDQLGVPFSVDLTVAYDIVGGGDDSAANDRAQALALRGVGSAVGAEANRLAARLSFIEGATAVFGAKCKKRRVAELQKVVAAALASAQVQLASKVLSQADFLNFRFLDDTYAARLVAADAEERAAWERMASWGPDVVQALRAQDAVDCDAGVTQAPARSVAMTPEAIVQLAAQLPSHAARRADRLSAAFDERAAGTELLPALSPFAGGRFGRRLGADQETVTALVGLTFDWNIPQARGRAAQTAARHAALAARRRVDESLAASEALIRSLVAQVESEQRVLHVLARSTASTQQLVKVLEVQRAIGDVDALNQATALLNAVDLELAVVNSLVRLETARLQLGALKEAVVEPTGPFEAVMTRDEP